MNPLRKAWQGKQSTPYNYNDSRTNFWNSTCKSLSGISHSANSVPRSVTLRQKVISPPQIFTALHSTPSLLFPSLLGSGQTGSSLVIGVCRHSERQDARVPLRNDPLLIFAVCIHFWRGCDAFRASSHQPWRPSIHHRDPHVTEAAARRVQRCGMHEQRVSHEAAAVM